MPPERRAVLLLVALAVAGQGARAWLGRPDVAPGGITLLAADSGLAVSAQRQQSVALDRPLRAGEKVDLDRAPVDEIARLPRVGRSLAKTIVADRKSRGPFGDLNGLDRVAGVGPGLLALLGPHVTFSGRPAGSPAGTAPMASGSSHLLDLNSADSAAFERLAGVGPFMAGKIVAYRTRHGRFSTVDDLLKVGGIGPATLARVRGSLAIP